MAKAASKLQGMFSFFDEVEKVEPEPKPQKHVLRPPTQIEATEETNEHHLADEPTETVITPAEEKETKETTIQEMVEEENPVADEAHNDEAVVETPNAIEPEAVLQPRVNADEKQLEKRNSRGRRSVKENAIAADLIEMPDEKTLFSRQYYSMKDVTSMFKENHSLIRYWESEFDILKPKKNGKGDRFFRPVDVKNLYLIYDLLRRRKFTIEGAKEFLKNNKMAEEKFVAIQSLEKVKFFLLELKASL